MPTPTASICAAVTATTTNPSAYPAATEVCDSVDNDCDGTFDTDASGGCDEICIDGVDNDDDGLLDCEDADCWGATCHPEGAEVMVGGGQLAFERVAWSGVDSLFCAMKNYWSGTATRAQGSAWGMVRVIPYGAKWSTASPTTCSWTADEVYVRWGRRHGWDHHFDAKGRSGSAGNVYRLGFHVASGCRIGTDDSWFLPSQLVAARNAPYSRMWVGYNTTFETTTYGSYTFTGLTSGALWYQGSFGSGTSWTTRWSDYDSPCSWARGRTTYFSGTWTLSTGSTYLTP